LPLILCFLFAACRSHSIKENPTFSEDIAPIIFKNCAPCHRPGEVGPFPLLSYSDVTKKAGTIAAVTKARYMPPWPADPSYSHFLGERVLTEDEIQLIQNWVVNGSPAGDPATAPPQPQFPKGSAYGKPDLVV
jgi:mono/diheme cytochrome c family protein